MSLLAPTMQAFFTDRLLTNVKSARPPSPPTATRSACSCDSSATSGTPPRSNSTSPTSTRRWSARSSPVWKPCGATAHEPATPRLAAIHSLFRFAAFRHPEHADDIARVLAIPQKRFDRGIVEFLHSAAMFLREAGLDISTIALWMGHESIASTQIYLHADLADKQRAGPHHPTRNGRDTLPAAGHLARLPRRPLIVPTSSRRSHRDQAKPASTQVRSE